MHYFYRAPLSELIHGTPGLPPAKSGPAPQTQRDTTH